MKLVVSHRKETELFFKTSRVIGPLLQAKKAEKGARFEQLI